ncbi:hypothetical protein QTI17_30550 [Variovorax sp. J31P179]|uniref:hypothetical protein n=1 Tax=Variovorax sp. J31P179 TaxID=3053508 RepID=UPI0025755045|nr:hypothetical protein [Variovorax sp. J31P179]MDM0084945.1 hypothetical protein [Variovorax sp. J31P179]
MPGFAGWRYLLSPIHAAPDICVICWRRRTAEPQNLHLHGAGAGVYPDRDRTRWPAHSNTLSFVEIVLAMK